MGSQRGWRRRVMLLAIALGAGMLVLAGSAAARTAWLCKPGQHPAPCTPGLATTVYSPTLQAERVVQPRSVGSPKIDCFYVYPTVSDQKGPLANLHVDPEECSIALYQAARYSQVCRVFVPMYRQVTVPALDAGNQESPAELAVPLGDVRRAFAATCAMTTTAGGLCSSVIRRAHRSCVC